MVSELDTRQYISEDTGPQRGWIVRPHISWRGKRNIFFLLVVIYPLYANFPKLRIVDDFASNF